jgi:hypothetical protein
MFYTISKRRTKLTDEILEEIGEVTETSVEGYKKYFNPNYWKNRTGEIPVNNYCLTEAWKVYKIRDEIIDSIDGAGTKETLLYGTLRRIDDMVQLSQVSDEFYKMKKQDMFTRIIEELSVKENYTLADALIGKPKYSICT